VPIPPDWTIPYLLVTGAAMISTAIYLQLSFRGRVRKAIWFSPWNTLALLAWNIVFAVALYAGTSWMLGVFDAINKLDKLQYTLAFIFGFVVILLQVDLPKLIETIQLSPEQLGSFKTLFDTVIGFYGRIRDDLNAAILNELEQESAREKDQLTQALRARFSEIDLLEQLVVDRLAARDDEVGAKRMQRYRDVIATYPKGSPEHQQQLLLMMTLIFTPRELKRFVNERPDGKLLPPNK
jgi:hypothetical protein